MKKNNLLQDNALRSIMKRRAEAAERVRLSEDFTDRLMASIEKQKTPSRQKKLWPYAASLLAIAASVLLILVFQYNKVEPEQQPVLAQQTEQQDSTIIKEVKEPTPTSVQETPVLAQAETNPKPKKTKISSKSHKEQPVIESFGEDITKSSFEQLDVKVENPVIQTIQISPDMVMYVVDEKQTYPTTDMPSISELRAHGARLTTCVQQHIRQASHQY